MSISLNYISILSMYSVISPLADILLKISKRDRLAPNILWKTTDLLAFNISTHSCSYTTSVAVLRHDATPSPNVKPHTRPLM